MAISLAVGVGALVAAWLLRVEPRSRPAGGRLTYECGEVPQGGAWVRFHPRYYVIALIFVLFDVEAVFLFPWALNIRELGHLALVEMVVFVGVLLLGWIYALRKGALRWQ